MASTHQEYDGVQNDLVPVVYDAVRVILNQILRAVTCLELLRDMDSVTGFILKNMDCMQSTIRKSLKAKSQQ